MRVLPSLDVLRLIVTNSRKRIFVADLQISRLALIFQILGLLADRAIGVKFVSARRRVIGPHSVT